VVAVRDEEGMVEGLCGHKWVPWELIMKINNIKNYLNDTLINHGNN
jgi:hypothetical protein